MTEERQTLTVEEVAEILGVGRNSAYEAVRRSEIPAIKIGRRLLVPKAALEQLLSRVPRLEPEPMHNGRPRFGSVRNEGRE